MSPALAELVMNGRGKGQCARPLHTPCTPSLLPSLLSSHHVLDLRGYAADGGGAGDDKGD